MVKDLGLRLWGENVVVLVVSSADKQRQRFTQVQAPRVEVKTLLPACLVLIVDYAITGELWRGIDIARAFGGSSMACPQIGTPPSL